MTKSEINDLLRNATRHFNATGRSCFCSLDKTTRILSSSQNNTQTERRQTALLENRPVFVRMPSPTGPIALPDNPIREHMRSAFDHVDKYGIPGCLKRVSHAEAFADIVYNEAITSPIYANGQLFTALDGKYRGASFRPEFRGKEMFWQRIMEAFNRGPVECSIAIGAVLGINPQYCFSVYPASQQRHLVGNSAVMPYLPDTIEAGGSIFKLGYSDQQKAFNGNVLYSVCRYQAGKLRLFLLACSVKGSDNTWRLAIGFEAAPLELLSHALIIANPKAHIFICTDLNIASRFREIAKECYISERKGVIVTGFVGGVAEMQNIPLSDLLHHPVTIVTQPDRDTEADLERFATNCQKAGASEVRLFPWPILTDEREYDLSLFTPDQHNEVNSNCLCLNRNYPASNLIDHILTRSISFDRKSDWMRKFLANDEKSVSGQNKPSKSRALNFLSFDDLPTSVALQADGPLEIGKMFSPQNATLIWGPSNAGKSWLAIQIAISLATGSGCFIWTASNPGKVGYFDGEFRNDFKARIKQLLPDADNNELFKLNFKLVTQGSDFDLLDKKTREDFIFQLKEHGIEYLIVDNLLALAPRVIKNASSQYFDFIDRLEASSIAVITIHHANKAEDDYKGPADLVALHQNVIQIEGHNQLEAKARKNSGAFDNNDWAEIQTALASKDRVVIRMKLTKTKVAVRFENRSFGFKLPIGGKWEPIGKCAEDDSISDSVEDVQAISVETFESNEQKTLQYFRANPEKPIKNADIQQVLGLKDGACLKILNNLLDNRLIEKSGSGNTTRYTLNKSA